MIKIGAVWQKTRDDGSEYYSGRVDLDAPIILSDENTIVLKKNKARESGNDRAPHYDVLIGKPKPKEGGSDGSPVGF